MSKIEEMKQLIEVMNKASEAYYSERDEIITDNEWDALFDNLQRLEQETGVVLENSPTHKVSYAADDGIADGEKVEHEYPALSLAKTKSVEDLAEWAGERAIWLSWKLDGLTAVATYDNGVLTRLATRGNGLVGTNITYLAPYIKGVPLKIADKNHVVVRGECLISNEDFAKCNAEYGQVYANARNLASGTLALDKSRAKEVAERNVTMIAFTPVFVCPEKNSWGEKMDYLDSLGFLTVQRAKTNARTVKSCVEAFTRRVQSGEMPYPVDGLVICYDDTAYAATGSVTGHHATRGGLAFKWADKPAETILRGIEWSCAAQSICPVAVFDPVQLEGTTVSRASLTNLSEIRRLGIGANGKTTLKVIKANMIIPKVIQVLAAEGTPEIPTVCPVCGKHTEIVKSEAGTETLICTNPDCSAKKIRAFERFASKEGMDINGLSTQGIVDLVNLGVLNTFSDFYLLYQHKDAISKLNSWGQKSCDNLLHSIEKSRVNCDPVHFIKALAIPLVGRDFAKRVLKQMSFYEFIDRIESPNPSFEDIEGVGPARSESVAAYFRNAGNRKVFRELLNFLDFNPEKIGGKKEAGETEGEASTNNTLSCDGLTFVITGAVHIFKNRDAFKEFVEAHGGKVSGSVSSKTSFLVNNDISSTSGKNKKAAELNVPIISEETFFERYGNP